MAVGGGENVKKKGGNGEDRRDRGKSVSIRGVVWIRYGVAVIKRDKQNV